MAQNNLGRNITFPIYNADGTVFHGLELKKATVDSVVMSLGDKVTGDVYYIDNALAVTMQEYIVVNSVKYTLVSPPTIVREGMVADNTQLKGMTKYSFTFYHPMYQLSNIPFTDVAVTQDQEKYLSQNKTFSWIGNLFEFVQKLRANLKNTQWAIDVEIPQYEQDGSTITPQWQKALKQSDVLSFDKNFISDALKTAYDTWEIPFVISHYESVLPSGYTRLKWVRISETHQSVTNTTAPFWLFIYNLNSVSADNKKIHYCKVFKEDTLLFDLIPCKDSNNNVGLYDVVEGVFYGSNQEVTFVAGEEIGENKKFNITFGLPINKIYDQDGNEYVFRFGKGLGLKNNSRTPRNNKIVTRIVGYGSENNIPFGYPQIKWFGESGLSFTYGDHEGVYNNITISGHTFAKIVSYPIYKGIYGGAYVELIKHPFTRKNLMPSIYSSTLFNKVSFLNQDGTPNLSYDPDTEIVDYYDADESYVNPINILSPSTEIHQFEDIKPELGETSIVADAIPYNAPEDIGVKEITYVNAFLGSLLNKITTVKNENEKTALLGLYNAVNSGVASYHDSNTGGSYTFSCDVTTDENFYYVKYVSDNVNYDLAALKEGHVAPETTAEWIDDIDEDGNYKQSYFKMKLPILDFDLYACASITQDMKINMRSGACIGCTFPIQVDWDDYKRNFYTSDGAFAPDGEQRDLEKYPKTDEEQVTLIFQKEQETFGTIMPNIYQQPKNGDKFVILGISLPTSYITTAEQSLDEAMKEYMLENNVHYFDYPLKFDEHFLATHQNILAQIKNNNIVKFQYAGTQMSLYIKQITIKYGDKPLPQYDITLTDDVEIVLNQIGQVTDDVSRMRVQVSELQKYYSENIIQAINEKLSKVVDDVCQGRITFQQGLDSIGSAIFHDELRSPDFTSGLYTGRGWRVDQLGNAELESLRVRSYLEIVELLVNRMQAQEGDTMFSDNDQIDKVDKIEDVGNVSYILSLKEKWSGYVTSQMYGNILKGIINTLAAKQSGVSDVTTNSVYYTSWMRVVDTHNTDSNLGVNQIRVELYNDNETPAGKNFEPCELMTIARWGCEVYNANYSEKYQAEGLATETAARESIKRRQRVFYLSTSEGRIVKLNSVYKPKLEDGNYGTTLGELPEFVKQYSAVAPRLVDGGDYLYAQGIVVGDFIKVDKQGLPLVNYVDKGEWQDNTEYLVNEYNSTTMQYETHDVWHNGSYWRCLVTQPHNGVYYEPTEANNIYWQKLLTSGAPAPFYTQELYAWSNVESTVNATTSPFEEPYAGWSESIPQHGSYAYLWKKIVKYTYNGTTDQYDQEPAQYFRMSGTNGTSIDVKGSIDYAYSSSSVFPPASSSLNGKKAIAKEDNKIWVCGQVAPSTYDWTPSGNTASDGFSYTIVQGNFNGNYQSTSVLTGHLVMWSTEAQDWVDLGRFKGEAGVTYYAHIAWAEDVRISAGNIVVTGFVTAKLPTDTTHIWMGTYVDTNSGQDPRNASLYVWSNTKGDKGDRGNIGRFFYFAGTFNPQDNDPTHVFEVNDAQAPYFEHTENGQKRYHVFNYETNGSYTMAQMWAISSNWNNKPWESMTNDFKYIITEAIFGSYAHFGASIINGDYLLSQYGYMRGFGNIKTSIADSTQYIYVDPNDMFGEDDWDLTDDKTIVNSSPDVDKNGVTSYTLVTEIPAFNLVSGRWYSIVFEGENLTQNNSITIALGTSASNIITGSAVSIVGTTGIDGFYKQAYINFKTTANYSNCRVYVKTESAGDTGHINWICVRYAQFVPNLCIDMKTGKLAANNIIARGQLYADSFVYEVLNANNNNEIINVDLQSIVNLGSSAQGSTVTLPSPLASKGRRIEVFNHSSSWAFTWVGAASGATCACAYGSGLGYRVNYNYSLSYMLFYCDGTTWWCLKSE